MKRSVITLIFATLGVASFSADRFWVGGSGNWNDPAHWSASSGGNGGASIPSASDDVFFDENSFFDINQQVVLSNMAICHNIHWGNTYGKPLFVGEESTQLHIYGSLNWENGFMNRFTGDIYFKGDGKGNTISNKQYEFLGNLVFEGKGSWQIQLGAIIGKYNKIVMRAGSVIANNAHLRANSILFEGTEKKSFLISNSIAVFEKSPMPGSNDSYSAKNSTIYVNEKSAKTGWLKKNHSISKLSIDSVTKVVVPPNCNSSCDGVISYTVHSAGGGPFTYLTNGQGLGTGSTTNPVTGVCGGPYLVKITDQSDASEYTELFSVTAPNPIGGTYTSKKPTCNGYCNGWVKINVTTGSGTSPYTYLWNNGQTGQKDTALCAQAGISVTIMDSKGCSQAISSTTLTQPNKIVPTLSKTDVDCNSNCTGTATASPTGGNGSSYTYSWSPGGQTSKTITNQCIGWKVVTVMDDSLCSGKDSIQIIQPTALSAGLSQTQPTCFSLSDGSASSSPTGGTSPYTYLWQPGGQTTSSINGLSAGNYTLTVTDAALCQTVTTFTLSQPNDLTLTPLGSTVNCNGDCDGTASVSVSGGTSPYLYSWSPGGGSAASLSALCANTYSVTVTDANGCSKNTTATVSQPSALTIASLFPVDPTCNGVCDGSDSVNVSGGTSPYTYSWSPGGQTSRSINGQCAGIYTITAMDSKGCVASTTDTLSNPNVLTAAPTSIAVTCAGGSNGSASANASGGTTPYSYLWSTGATTATVNGLPAGTYNITVTDANGCTDTKSVTVSQPTVLSLSITSSTSSCNICNGSATVSASGGTPGYTYLWNSTPTQSNPTANNLCVGTYTVYVTDNVGCSDSVSVVISPVVTIAITTSGTSPSCNGSCDAIATANASNGNPPYVFSWTSGSSSSTASNLCAGSYTVTVTDQDGCFNTDVVTFTDPLPLTLTPSKTNATCNSICNGTASVSVSGGTGSYNYLWDTGDTVASISNLCAGTYTITVTDSMLCTDNTTIIITEPTPITDNNNVTTATCTLCDGGISLAPAGSGGGPYTYLWNTGSTTNSIINQCAGIYTVTVTDGSNGCSQIFVIPLNNTNGPTIDSTVFQDASCYNTCDGSGAVYASTGFPPLTYLWPGGQTSSSLASLCDTSYVIKVTDGQGCITFAADTVNEPQPLSPNITKSNVSCGGLCDGQIALAPSGGTPGYNYLWIPGGSTSASVTNLCANTYTATITDATGTCDTTIQVIITAPSQLAIDSIDSTNVTCKNAANGSAIAYINGGTPGYTYTWNPNVGVLANVVNLGPGTYSLTVTDANGCKDSSTVSITEPALSLSATVTKQNASCFSVCDGQVSVSPSGGTPGYTYLWIPGLATTPTVNGLCAGAYSYLVTDANGCTASNSIIVSQPAVLSASLTPSSTSCFGICDGSVTSSVSGGTAPFTYSWAPGGSTSANPGGYCAGTYTVTVTDSSGCSTQTTTTVSQPADLQSNLSKADPSCPGSCDGTATSSPIGGTSPYMYSWSPGGQTTASIGSLCEGSYIVISTDSKGCKDTSSITLNDPGRITVNFVTADASCGKSDGTATAIPSGGTPPYTYLWSTGGTSDTIINKPAGIYTVTVTDADGCSGDTILAINNNGGPTGEITAQDSASCFGICDGMASLVPVGGTAPYTYLWNDPLSQTNDTAFNLCAGAYLVQVTDANSCVRFSPVTVHEPTQILANETVFSATCAGICDGSILLAPSGGVGGYTYLWNPGGSTASSSVNLCAGTYTITITDATTCSSAVTLTVGQSNPVTANVSTTPESCNGACDGTATANVLTGMLPYAYQWNDPLNQTTITATGLCAGTDSVKVTDGLGCYLVAGASISSPLAISISATSTEPTCGSSNGQINITASGGSGGYTYLWNTGSTSASISGLSAGVYSLTVSDNSGCSSNFTITLNNSNGPTGITPSITDASCYGLSDGSASITPVGGTPPYTYLWNPGGQTSNSISGQSAGTYFVQVTDSNGCIRIDSVVIGSPSQIVANQFVTSPNCNTCNGEIAINPTGGAGPYTILWNTGSSNDTISSLCAGLYVVNLSDANGCSSINNITLSNTGAPTVSAVSTDITCYGACDGTATATVSGGTAPYNYLWSPGNQTTDSISSLCSDTYILQVTDDSGCVAFANAIISEPQQISIGSQLVVKPACSLPCNGSISISPAGGTAPYTYLWNTGATINSISSICAGLYQLDITDSKGCSSSVSVTLNSSSGPSSASTNIADATCFGTCDGAASVTPVGGTAPYSYLWIPGGQTIDTLSSLCAGNYNIQITDSNNCTYVASLTINQNSQIQDNAVTVSPSKCQVCDGSITVTPSGGNAPYTYNWSNGSTSNSISGLCAGIYSLTITGADGCSQTFNYNLSNSQAPSVTLSSTDPLCFGSCNGNIKANATGGYPPYNYLWSPVGQISDSISGICSGTYTVQVTDDSSCVAFANVTLNDPPQLSIGNQNIKKPSCSLPCDGSVSILPVGGTAPYTYSWNTGSIANSIDSICAGIYQVDVTDAKGCVASLPVTINSSSGPSSITANVTNATCYGLCDGAVSIVPVGGTAPYAYQWLPGGQTSNSLSSLCAGSYNVQITDSNNCVYTSSVNIGGGSQILANESQTPPSACLVCDGMISVNPSGGTGSAYTYLWNTGSTGSNINSLCAGLYNVTITDSSGCSENISFALSNTTAPAILTTFNDPSCFGKCDANIKATVTGGVPPYNYLWTPGSQTTDSIFGLCSGTYTLQVIDDSSCTSFATTVITDPSDIILSAKTVVDATCGGPCNGSISVGFNGGALPYTYTWSNGDSGTQLDSVCAGLYDVLVTDAKGCSSTTTISVNNIGGPTSAAIVTTDASCNGTCNGTANVSPIGGTAPYTYLWVPGGLTSNTVTGLCADDYFIQIADSNGCLYNASLTISEPQGIMPNTVVVNPSACLVCDGTVSVNPTGGTLPYSYLWSNSSTTANINSLCGGLYILEITDGKGCKDTITVPVVDIDAPQLSISSTDLSCYGTCNGTAQVFAIGGTPGYTYLWTDGSITNTASALCAKQYFVQVTDQTGCVAAANVTLKQPNQLILSAPSVMQESCPGKCDGTASLMPIGGTIPYTYSWTMGNTTATASNLCAGNYTGTVTDAKGCSTQKTATITSPLPISITISSAYSKCLNTNDGSIDITVTGGTPAYSYQWSGAISSSSEDVPSAGHGKYVIDITDSKGCKTSDTIKLAAIDTVIANAGSDTTFCLGGSFLLNATGSYNALSYNWYLASTMIANAATATVTPAAGTSYYHVIATKNTCSDTDTVAVISLLPPIVDPGSAVSILIDEQATLGGNPTGPFGSTYAWTPLTAGMTDSTLSNPVVSPKSTTTYTVYVTDSKGCINIDSVTVTVVPVVKPTSGFTPNGDGKNDEWDIPNIGLFPDCLVEIYNRWGELLFSSPGYSNKWNGTFKGAQLPVGTYYYIITLNDPKYPDPITGPITILR